MPPETDWALFLDFDGTLVDIAGRPDEIVVDRQLPSILAALNACFNGALAIVSGRRLEVLDHYLKPYAADAAGLHGLELRVAGKVLYPQKDPNIKAVFQKLEGAAAAVPGVLLEDKIHSIGLHWRQAPHYSEQVLVLAREAKSELGDAYRLQRGKCVVEILPAQANKAQAIARILATPGYRNRRPIFVGDDMTDEGGFCLVNGRGGLSVHIGEGPTSAHFKIATPGRLRGYLCEWAERALRPEQIAGRFLSLSDFSTTERIGISLNS